LPTPTVVCKDITATDSMFSLEHVVHGRILAHVVYMHQCDVEEDDSRHCCCSCVTDVIWSMVDSKWRSCLRPLESDPVT